MILFTRRLMLLILFSLVINTTVCLGQTVLSNRGDSLICFSLNQGKWLLKQAYKVREVTALDSICEAQLTNSNKIIDNQKIEMNNKDLINNNNNELLQLKQDEVNNQKNKVAEAKKALRKEKVKRLATTVVATLIIAYETYLLVIKKC